ncbi:MAG: chloride channel protein [Deltaproteobacteria bacterium]|nr:chloride channel protein [Deltaproteobacteria bacterium]
MPGPDPRQTSASRAVITPRVVAISLLAVVIAAAAAVAAQGLTHLIALITNLAFYGRLSASWVGPAGHHLGAWVICVPVAGALLIGVLARWGSPAIRGHGIPEAMEQVLYNDSRVPARMTLLKPLSAAISIGTGGPFGAEGPIIATGGALGSLLGQLLPVTHGERKTLLAAGAAAGMSATFGSPVAAVLLAVELLLFELRPRSLIPVALAAATAAAVRIAFLGSHPAFLMPDISEPAGAALLGYVLIGAVIGVASAGVSRLVYAVEDAFEHLRLHWMWWPALGGLVVGVIGWLSPRTMGVGYDNIEALASGAMLPGAIALLVLAKWVSWSISLGSGTSGGTLAPLFTLGAGLGGLLGGGMIALWPGLGIDVRIAGLVGMAAMFAGASRALLTSIVFAYETTRHQGGLLPLLAGCSAAYLSASLTMRTSIMTEKLARRGARVPDEYEIDPLHQLRVHEVASRPPSTLGAQRPLAEVRAWLASDAPEAVHHSFPVVDGDLLVGMVTREELLDQARPGGAPVRAALHTGPVHAVREDATVREAMEIMAVADIGRVPVLGHTAPHAVVAILSRSDLLSAERRRLAREAEVVRTLRTRFG